MRVDLDAREAVAFVAAAIGGFAIVFFLGNPLSSLPALAASIVLLGVLVGGVAVLRQAGGREDELEEELSELADVIAAQEVVPNQEQILYELDRADRALDRGDADEAEEAIIEIERLLS